MTIVTPSTATARGAALFDPDVWGPYPATYTSTYGSPAGSGSAVVVTVRATTAQSYATAQGAAASTQDGEPAPTMIASAGTASAVGRAQAARPEVVLRPTTAGAVGRALGATSVDLSVRQILHAGTPIQRTVLGAGAPVPV